MPTFVSSSLRVFALLSAVLITQAGRAQNVNLSIDFHLAEINRASHIVIPQSRAIPLVEQFGRAMLIDSVEARVKILESTASTTLEIALRNPGSTQTEAILLLPVPDDAAVSSFMFEGAASEPTAQILRKDEARRLYDSIVNRVRDPALLEFAGYNLIRTSVFPVAAGGTQKVRLTYENILPVDGHRIDFIIPRSESLNQTSPWNISVDVTAKHPISMVYSPTHDIITERLSRERLSVKLADSSRLDPGPFMLSYLLERNGVTASMFAYPDPKIGVNGGYFLLMAGLPASIAEHPNLVKREVTIVIDRSGSMAGAKMDQARAAAIQVLEGLAEGEAFNIIDYSTTVSTFAVKPVIKDQVSRLEARRYVENLRPGGGTNIHDALLEALRPAPTENALPIVLFLTDGLPTVGNTSEVAIRELVEKGNAHRRRVFTFGVGHDVNVPLLDRVADVTRAVGTYVLPEEDVEVKVAQVFKRLYGPVLADLALETHDASGQPSTRLVRDLIPAKLPDIFEGDQLILLGQYQQSDQPLKFRLTGSFLGQPREFDFEFDLAQATTKNAFVPRLWASRRIAYLVDQIRQAGAESGAVPAVAGASIFHDPRYREISDEILRLSTEFGILTEYTAFLATEGTNLNDWNTLRDACGLTLENRAVKTRSGQYAVNQGMNFNFQKQQEKLNYQNGYWDDKLNRVEISTVQQVCDRAFYKRGSQWIDARLVTPDAQGNTQTEFTPDATIEYGSPEHLALLHALVAQNRQGVLALDGDIMIQHEGRNILVKNRATETSSN